MSAEGCREDASQTEAKVLLVPRPFALFTMVFG